MTKDEIKHIKWMYSRLTSVHKENENFDYMKRFKEIIDKQLTLCDVVVPKGTLCDDCKELKTDTITLCKECYLND